MITACNKPGIDRSVYLVFVSRGVLAQIAGEHGHFLAVDVPQVVEEQLGLVYG